MAILRNYPVKFERDLARDIQDLVTSRGGPNFRTLKEALHELIEVSDIEDIIRDLPIGELISPNDAALLNKSISGALLHGAEEREVLTLVVDFFHKKTFVDTQFDAVSFYGNNFFNQVVGRDIVREINRQEGVTERIRRLRGTQEGLEKLVKIVDRHEIDSPSIRLQANLLVSRSYTYGVLKSGQLRGHRGYQLKATIDERTSAICLSLDGKTFSLAEGVRKLEEIALAKEEDIETLHPWVNDVEQVAGLQGNALASIGFLLPPFHPNCRTITIPF